jgi:hypothetical protein
MRNKLEWPTGAFPVVNLCRTHDLILGANYWILDWFCCAGCCRWQARTVYVMN